MAKLFRQLSRVVFASLSLLLLTAACSAAPEPTAAPLATPTSAPGVTPVPQPTPAATMAPLVVRPTHWRWAVNEEPTGAMDLMSGAGGVGAGRSRDHIYDGMMAWQGPEFKASPILAESWEYITPTHLRFKLRQGIKFHNGDPLTVEDVYYNAEDNRTNKKRGTGTGVTTLEPISEFKVVDPYTLDVLMKREFGPILYTLQGLGTLGAVPKAYRERVGPEEFSNKPVGTGAYKFVSQEIGQKVDLEANASFWEGPVFPPRLTIFWFRDASTRAAAFLAGTIEGAEQLPPEEHERIRKDPNLELAELKGNQMIATEVNFGDPPFNSLTVRKALNLATDKEGIIKGVLGGRGGSLAAMQMPGQLGHNPDLKPYPYDPAAAKKLLKDGGYEGLSFEYSTVSGVFPKDTEIAEFNLTMWAQVGLKPQLKIVTRAAASDNRGTLSYQVAQTGMWGLRWEVDGIYGQAFMNPGIKVGRTISETTPEGARVKELWTAQRSTADIAKRGQIMRELEKYLWDNYLGLFTHSVNNYHGSRKALGWYPYPWNGGNVQFPWYDRWATVGLTPRYVEFK